MCTVQLSFILALMWTCAFFNVFLWVLTFGKKFTYVTQFHYGNFTCFSKICTLLSLLSLPPGGLRRETSSFASVRVRPYYINRLITWTLLKLLLWKLNMFSLRKKVPLKNFCLYFGLLLTNLWPLGTNTLWPLFREKFLTDCHQSSYLALVYYSPDLIRFWCTLAYFWRSYDVFF